MTKAVVPQSPGIDLEKVLIKGDLAALTPPQRVQYYTQVCESLGLNPLTKPFDYIVLNGKLTLYAKKDAAEQLRSINNVSITDLETQDDGITFKSKAHAALPNGRTDVDIGVVSIKGLTGDTLANAKMKGVTKSKRRVTLSICGLGFLDETEIETIADAKPVIVAPDGNIIDHNPKSQSKLATKSTGIDLVAKYPKEYAPFDNDGTDKQPVSKPNGKRPFEPSKVKSLFIEAVNKYTGLKYVAQDGDRGAVIHNLEMCFAGDPDSTACRHAVSFFLTGKHSSKDWNDAEIIALKNWLNAKPDDGGEWHPDPNTVREAIQINIVALKAEGQQELIPAE